MENWSELFFAVGGGLVVFVVVVFPAARLIEEFTNEPIVKRIWKTVFFIFALMIFVGMYGIGQFFESYGKSLGKEQPADHQKQEANQ